MILIIIILVLLIIAISFIIWSLCKKQNYYEQYEDIYSNFAKNLNSINKKVRKNNFTYFQVSYEITEWAIKQIKKITDNCSHNFFILNSLYRGDPNLEFNYSHTMADKVVLSDNDYQILLNDYNKKSINSHILSTIIHEFVHVHQRQNFDTYKEFYTTHWGYHFSKIKNNHKLLKYKRQNPDADDDDCIWNDGQDNYYFINCFFDKQNLSPYIINEYAYPIKKEGTHFIYKNEEPILLSSLESYNNFFGNTPNNYTPNEIYADYTEMLFRECTDPLPEKLPPAFIIFKKNYLLK